MKLKIDADFKNLFFYYVCVGVTHNGKIFYQKKLLRSGFVWKWLKNG